MRETRYEVSQGDALTRLRSVPDNSIDCVVTSPPYWQQRSYGTEPQVWSGDPEHAHVWSEETFARGPKQAVGATSQRQGRVAFDTGEETAHGKSRGSFCACGAWRGELGSEPSLDGFIANLTTIFRKVRRVLSPTGTCWVNMGDSFARSEGKGGSGTPTGRNGYGEGYAGGGIPDDAQEKDLLLIPARMALAFLADGWRLRAELIWNKGESLNPERSGSAKPESATDRPSRAHEQVYLFTKAKRYYYDRYAIRADGSVEERRNLRSVLTMSTDNFPGGHFATFPVGLASLCLLVGSSEVGVCPVPGCRAPWVRVVEAAGAADMEARRAAGADATGEYHGTGQKEYAAGGAQDPSALKARILQGMVEKRTAGWVPTCPHGHAPVNAEVLDPFAGSGSTLIAAIREGRNGLGFELNPDNVALAMSRIAVERTGARWKPPSRKATTQGAFSFDGEGDGEEEGVSDE